MMKISIASDHAGFEMKQLMINYLVSKGHDVMDCGPDSADRCDYPDYAAAACRAVLSGECDCAILVCGTGVGMSIAANKFDGIRAACCSDTFSARFTRLHNDANVLCMGQMIWGDMMAVAAADADATVLVASLGAGATRRERLSCRP